jgi:hypothetical protein
MSIPSNPDDFGDGNQPKWNDDHKGRDDYAKNGDEDGRSDDGDRGKGDAYDNPGEALAKFDFSQGDLGSHRADQSGDILGALASMSSDEALEYAIGQMSPADHLDAGHFDVTADTSHDADT